jgi:hypothetical protein
MHDERPAAEGAHDSHGLWYHPILVMEVLTIHRSLGLRCVRLKYECVPSEKFPGRPRTSQSQSQSQAQTLPAHSKVSSTVAAAVPPPPVYTVAQTAPVISSLYSRVATQREAAAPPVGHAGELSGGCVRPGTRRCSHCPARLPGPCVPSEGSEVLRAGLAALPPHLRCRLHSPHYHSRRLVAHFPSLAGRVIPARARSVL